MVSNLKITDQSVSFDQDRKTFLLPCEIISEGDVEDNEQWLYSYWNVKLESGLKLHITSTGGSVRIEL